MNPLDPVREAAAAFHLQASVIESVAGGFSGTRVWKVQDESSRTFALRLLPTVDRRAAVRLAELSRWMETLHDSGIAVVPRPLRCGAKNSIAAAGVAPWLHHSQAGVWLAETWMSGTPFPELPSTAAVTELVRVLQSIHASGRRSALAADGSDSLFSAREGPSPAVQRRVRMIEELLQGRIRQLQEQVSCEPDTELRDLLMILLRQLPAGLTRVMGELRQEARRAYQLQPVLRDLWYPHALFTGERLSGIVDWQAVDTDHRVVDAARLLRSWCRTDASEFDRGLQVFAAEWALSAGELRLLRTLDQAAVLLSPLTWLQGRYRSVRQRDTGDPASRRLRELLQVAIWACAEPWS